MLECYSCSWCCSATVVVLQLVLECYSSMVAVLAGTYPLYIEDHMAYQQTIIGVGCNYEEPAWFLYNRIYHFQAAAHRALN